MNYSEAVDYIFGHTNWEVVPRGPHTEETYDLRRVTEVLERLGNPHLKAVSLHIAGTNGKGSTAAMLSGILSSAGFDTGLYTSPHLQTMRERISVNGEMISESAVAELMTVIKPEVEAVNRGAKYGRLTVFEILTVLSFVYFASKNCRFQVMEVGMGGRFDATNVINPAVCMLTSISMDHHEVLGDTVEKIAAEKCGIIKPGCVVVSHPQLPQAEMIIKETCKQRNVRLLTVGKEIQGKEIGHNYNCQWIEVQGRLGTYNLKIPLIGKHQIDNAAAAVAAVELLIESGSGIELKHVEDGMAGLRFPGRIQVIDRNPWIILDGGHNPGASVSLRSVLEEYFKPDQSILVFGCSSDKDIPGLISILAPYFHKVIVTKADNPRSAQPEILANEFMRQGKEAVIIEKVAQALNAAKSTAAKNDLICITGSLFVVGEALTHLTSRNPA
jgi:dihydrofolate synthase / folylpolyglutamate synthase